MVVYASTAYEYQDNKVYHDGICLCRRTVLLTEVLYLFIVLRFVLIVIKVGNASRPVTAGLHHYPTSMGPKRFVKYVMNRLQ